MQNSAHAYPIVLSILIAAVTLPSPIQAQADGGLAIATNVATDTSAVMPFERTEEREPCTDHDPLKRPMFGDLHVHSSFSFDSYISSQRNEPTDAYRYAKGEAITLPDVNGEQLIEARIQRPLDFTSVTDHAEYLGPINMCTKDSSKLGYWWPHCMMTRASHFWTQMLAASWWTNLGGIGTAEVTDSFACTLSDCNEAALSAWGEIQRATEEHYDRSSDCTFTTFVGYEYTDAPNAFNMHRNVIFRNERVPELPISTYDTGTYNFPILWELLQERCLDAGIGCDVLAIPHNSNLSGGLMFRDPQTPREAADRLKFEPVIELVQHKGASECRFDRLEGRGLLTADEACDFEQVVADNLSMLGTVHGEMMTEQAAAVPLDEYHPRNMARNALKAGLELGQETGTNPFQFGFIASTDTHSATAGGAEEDNYVGHLGRRDAEYANVQDHFFSNPGGHAVVWAEENSRDAIFEGMRSKETYATSGTRPIVRFFGGTNLDLDLCGDPDMVSKAYSQGVPMGGAFGNAASDRPPRFLVSALKDAGIDGHPGTDLQRVQIIKGWVDASGESHEKVIDVAGDANNGASVDPNTCAPTGGGASALCTVWQDDEYDATQPSFYYVRVLENPTCRWSTFQCQAAGVNPFSASCEQRALRASIEAEDNGAPSGVWENCCTNPVTEPFYTPTIQERAWTSSIWVNAISGEPAQQAMRSGVVLAND